MLEVKNLTKTFYLDKRSVFSIKNVSLSFKDHGLYALIGPSGSGKSTLLSLIIGLKKADSGSVIFNGEITKDFYTFRKNNVGVIFQNSNLLEDYSGSFNYQLPLIFDDLSDKSQIYKNYNLNEDIIKRNASTFSGGEKQRVALCRALVRNPKIIIADEPTGSLDYTNGRILMNQLKAISKTKLVILVSHNMKLVKEFADYIICINEGKVEEIKENSSAKEDSDVVVKYKKKYSFPIFTMVIKRIRKNLSSFLLLLCAMSITIFSSSVFLSFSTSVDASFKENKKNYIDYNVFKLSKQKTSEIDGSFLKMTQVSRPSVNEIQGLKKRLNSLNYAYDFSSLLQPSLYTLSGNRINENIRFSPIFDFPSLSSNEVIANNLFFSKIGLDDFYLQFSSNVIYEDQNLKFDIKQRFKTVLVKEESASFNTPAIFYNYFAFEEYLNSLFPLIDKSWLSIIKEANGSEPITNYGMIIYTKTKEVDNLINLISNSKSNEVSYILDSNSLRINETYASITNVINLIRDIFLVLIFISFILVMVVASYAETFTYRKESAIESALGIKKENILLVFIIKNLLSLVCAFIVSYFLSKGISLFFHNVSIYGITIRNALNNFIAILGIIFLIAFILTTLITYISYLLTSRNLDEEVRNE